MRRLVGSKHVIAGVLLLGGLAGAGCTASASSHTAAGTAPPRDVANAWHQVVQCARAHGMPNLPDPQIDSSGQAHFPGGTPKVPDATRRACQSLVDRLPPSARGGDAHPPTDIQGLLRFANCMRQHGVPDFPDPHADGTFPFAGTRLGREGKTPRLINAMRACDRLNPDPNGRIYGS